MLARAFVVTLCLTAFCFSVARADESPTGKVVLAKVTGEAVALYDASADVAAIVKDGSSTDEANRRLQRVALAVLAKELPEFKTAKSAVIRVTYARNGDVSPAYGSPTFAGIERYANLKCDLADARSDRSGWSTDSSGKLPSWATFEIVGELPPKS